MISSGIAQFAGKKSGLMKDGNRWGSVVLDNPDNLMERIQVFVRDDELIDACSMLSPGCLVNVQIRLYAGKDGLGSTLLSIVPADEK